MLLKYLQFVLAAYAVIQPGHRFVSNEVVQSWRSSEILCLCQAQFRSFCSRFAFVPGVDSSVQQYVVQHASLSWQSIDVTNFAFASGVVALVQLTGAVHAPSPWWVVN